MKSQSQCGAALLSWIRTAIEHLTAWALPCFIWVKTMRRVRLSRNPSPFGQITTLIRIWLSRSFACAAYNQAVASFRQALALDASDYQIWGNLADAYYYGGETSQSVEPYKKAISMAEQQLKVNPRAADVLADLADYYSMLGDRKQSLAYLDRALEVRQGDKELLFIAAVVYNQLHETGTALEWLGKALDAGYSRAAVAEASPLDNLHSNPRYQALMQAK